MDGLGWIRWVGLDWIGLDGLWIVWIGRTGWEGWDGLDGSEGKGRRKEGWMDGWLAVRIYAWLCIPIFVYMHNLYQRVYTSK